jgi:hypothetical protein
MVRDVGFSMASDTWLDRADWRHRSPEFGSLRELSDSNGEPIAVMEFEPPGASDVPAWASTRRLWCNLPVIPNVVAVVADNTGPLLLRHRPAFARGAVLRCLGSLQ